MIIPLNIVLSYPVHWGKYEVFRDFIQNFYDSVGYQNWNKSFHYEYDDAYETLTMWVDDVQFSYEWLMHIGASTKTDASSNNAGYFGEGFKIASLCAVRDHGLYVTMASGDWELTVKTIDHKIEDRTVQMLAYDVNTREPDHRSVLSLEGITQSGFSLFQHVLLSFYYPENPLMGEKIWEGESGAVYTVGKEPYHKDLPFTRDFGQKNPVFCSYQLMGSSPFRLVACLHHFKKEDRERKALYAFDIVDVFESLAWYVDAKGAVFILEKMRRNWNSIPEKEIDIDSWYTTVCSLVNKIRSSEEATLAFRERHPNLLCLRRIKSVSDRNRRHQARAWLNMQTEKYILVHDAFLKLGYPTLESVCERNGGFTVNDCPTKAEKQGFVLLEQLVQIIYEGFFDFEDKLPEQKIIRNRNASYHGMATLFKNKKKSVNIEGLDYRYQVAEIFLKETVFQKDKFYDALATYVHECCHTFGGDSSAAFSQGLTFAMEILMTNAKIIEQFKIRWEKLYS